jgi:2-hydroxy-4-carboxymuconate semialdehyde hemiacetal dehydrogenase
LWKAPADRNDGKEQNTDVSKVDVSMDGIELQDREFFSAKRNCREPDASVARVLPCYRTLHELEQQLQRQS